MKTLGAILACAALVLTPLKLGATVIERDVLIKASGPAVYYLASDDHRYVFPNQKVFNSWFTDFSGVITVSDAELASYPIGGNVTYRPGISMVKITTDPRVYAVDRGGVLRWVTSESVAAQMYGSDWNQLIDDVPGAFFFSYAIGDPIYSLADYAPATTADLVRTINADMGLPTGAAPQQADTVPLGEAVASYNNGLDPNDDCGHNIDLSLVRYGYNLVVDSSGREVLPQGRPFQEGYELIGSETYVTDHNTREYA